MLANQGPVIGVTEAIHGTYKTNFEMPKKDPSRVGLPLGGINDSPVAKKAIFAREQSLNSIKYLAEAEDEGLSHTLGNSPTMMIEKSGKNLLEESFN